MMGKLLVKIFRLGLFSGFGYLLYQVQMVLNPETVLQGVLVLKHRVVKQHVKLLTIF